MNANEFIDWLRGYLDASPDVIPVSVLKEKLKNIQKVNSYIYPSNPKYPNYSPYTICSGQDVTSVSLARGQINSSSIDTVSIKDGTITWG